jgi:ABC-type transporter Mla subunit MlaD
MTEPTNADVLDAVTLELSRFTREVVAEMHRLRDELAAERQRTDQLEASVRSLTTSLRKFDTQAANIVDHITKLSADVDRRLDNVERQAGATPSSMTPVTPRMSMTPPAAEHAPTAAVVPEQPAAGAADEPIQFAPLMLTLDPVEPPSPHDSSIDDLVARVVAAIDAPPPSPLDQDAAGNRIESSVSR